MGYKFTGKIILQDNDKASSSVASAHSHAEIWKDVEIGAGVVGALAFGILTFGGGFVLEGTVGAGVLGAGAIAVS